MTDFPRSDTVRIVELPLDIVGEYQYMPIKLGSLMIWGFLACFALVALNASLDGRRDGDVFPKVSLKKDGELLDLETSIARR